MKQKLRTYGVSGVQSGVACMLLLLGVSLQLLVAQPTQDFGDAPAPYPTTLKDDGPRHTVTGPLLGTVRDAEFDGLPDTFAFGDDNDNTDDEDGVVFVSAVVPGQAALIEVTVSGASANGARLDGWLDFDGNGSWAETADHIFASRLVNNGVNALTFAVPAAAKGGITFARFRISNAGDLNFTGSASNGEVEDYRVSIGEAMDFGDAPTNSYPTLLLQNGARHRIVSNFMLGTKIDAEPDGQPNSTATGDDLIPSTADDEDGVVFTSALSAGSNATVDVFCTLPAGMNAAKLNAWVDFTGNGDWADSGEQIFQDKDVFPGVNHLSFAVPASARGGLSFARFRLNANGKINYRGSTSEGEVEDYQVSIVSAQDFGDAPSPYPTLLANNGARHNFTNTFCLGVSVDGETDGQPDSNAKGDDANNLDDEDGVTFTSSITPGTTATVQVYLTGFSAAGGPAGVLNAWMDFNRDGDWADAGEQIFTNVALVPGYNSLTFTVPSGASQGSTFARFRLNQRGGLSYVGSATDGEVEDYQVNISPRMDFGDAPRPYPTLLADDGARHIYNSDVFLGGLTGIGLDSEPDGQPDANALGDDLNGPDENGVTFTSLLIPGSPVTLQVRASTTGFLHAWVDFNGNGSWIDAGEKVFNTQVLTGGVNNLSFNIPADAKGGRTFARFRFTTFQGALDFVGLAPNGEVEDYQVTITPDRERCDHNCEGKEFWLTFPGNYAPDLDNPAKLSLCLMGSAGIAANISVPGIGFSTNVIIPATQAINVPLPRAAELGDLVDVITNRGIHVVASGPVSITGFDHARYTTDSYMALHTSVLGTKYIVQGFGNTQSGVPPLNGTQFALVASESNTVVAILPSVSAGSRTGGVPYLLQLQPGDAYQLRSTNDAPADLSRTLILSDKPIAVFGGHQCANVPSSNVWFCDYLVEQILPINTWGKEFYTAPLATRFGGDTFRLMASQNNTTIYINGVALAPLNIAQFHQIPIGVRAQILADKPILVTQYANSGDYDGSTNADPFMLTVQATRHYVNGYRICTPTNDFPTNYVNLVAPTANAGSISIDGVAVGAAAFSAIGASGYSAARVGVSPGRHLLSGKDAFGVSVYGWAEYDSYAHPACMYFGDVVAPSVVPTTTAATLNVNDYPNTPGFVPSPNFTAGTTVSDNCDREFPSPTQTPRAGLLVPPGVYTYTLSVQDSQGNIGETNVTLTVLDPSQVVINCPADMQVHCQSNNGAIVNFAVTAHSTYDTNVPVVSVPPSGSFFPSGTTTVVSTATSLAGQSNTCSFTVTVLCDTRINTVVGKNGLQLSWPVPATLQMATNPAGPWSNVVSRATSFVAPLTGKQGYFRVLY